MTREEHINLMIEQLNDPDFMRSSNAGYNLLRHGEYAIQPLIDALPNVKPNVQRIIVGLLQKMGTPAVLPLKEAILISNGIVSQRMITALSGIDDPDVSIVLMELIHLDDQIAKREVIRGLRKQRDPQTIDFLLRELPISDDSTRSVITHALVDFGGDSVDPLLQLIKTDIVAQDKALLIRILITLGRLKDERAIPVIEPYLNNPHPDVRQIARRALRQIGYEVGV